MTNHKEKTAAAEAKPKLHLVPPMATRRVARVMEFGAKKHGNYNYVECTDPVLYIDAAMRHINAQVAHIHGGNDGMAHDSESGLEHLAHAAASIMIALELYLRKAG